MKKIITFSVLLLTISSMTWAYDFSSVAPSDLSSTPHTDVIGSGTTTSVYFPSYSYYNYSLSQQIYYASEFNAISIGDTIVKIGFQLGAMVSTRNWNIYITTTNQASLSDGFIQISPNDLVWSGTTASMTANAWNEITLYSGIVFNGSNILVTFQDVTGSYQNSNRGIVTATGISGISRYIYRDNDGAYDPTAAVSGGTASADRLNMRFVSGSLNVNRDGDFIFSDRAKTHLIRYTGAGGSITIPSTVTTIGDGAFSACSGLTSVTIPNSVTTIGNEAFSYCSGLASVSIGNSVVSIGSYAFDHCEGLTSVTIPNSVTSIGDSVFYYCFGLTSVTIGNSVTSIGNYAFYNCSGLTSVAIPNSVTSIGNEAFSYCSGLASVTIPNSVTSIGDYAFCSCSGLTSVTIPNSVTSIGDYAFSGCRGLASVTIGNSVTSIGDYAFYWCSSLTSVTIPNSVTSIGHYAFSDCGGLTSIVLGCTTPPQIETSTFPGSVTYPVTFHVPCNTTETYRNTAIWNRAYYQYVEDMGCPTQVVVVANDTTLGTVTGGGTYLTGQTVTLTATAKPDCHFLSWQDGNSQNPRTITIDSSDSYLTFTAIFALDTFVVTVVSNNPNLGTVSGSGSYLARSTAILCATPMYDCRFVQWSDGIRTNPRTLCVASDTTLLAIFRVNPDTVFVPVHDTTYIDVHDTTWVPYPVHDTTFIDVHDTTYIPVHDTTFIDVHDTTFIPVHDTIVMHDTVGSRITYYELSILSDNVQRGVVAGNGRFPDSTIVEIAAIPIEGYRFLQWNDGNTDNPRSVQLLGADTTFVATFEPSTQSIDAPQSDDDVSITTRNGQIVVSNVANRNVRLFDSVGRLLSTSNTPNPTRLFTLPTSGVYLIQVGTAPAHRVVVVQ